MLTSAALLLSLTSLLAASADSVGYSPKISIRALPNSEIHHLEIYGAPAGPDFVRELVFEKVNDTPYGFKLTAIGLSGHNGQGAPANPSPPAGGWQAGTGTFTYVLAGKDPISCHLEGNFAPGSIPDLYWDFADPAYADQGDCAPEQSGIRLKCGTEANPQPMKCRTK
ncbi:uncharacterized protein MKK02DRAFT_40085 [Dioszegia hungarica]|uniref:Uncharacterized protein n=1 Tax=Dioszegia hungarica TaxID=4972 RepID=A0AA38HFM3_9TREE|nr:uncharacterized protein MKK02DRAFT_40085 [Dioszegia hungarica]KAI9639760.1 hypothetical protein MKK02DRAFT_40085 [Dioszegia hungarica]